LLSVDKQPSRIAQVGFQVPGHARVAGQLRHGTPARLNTNTHEAAFDASPECRVLYVDNDREVSRHAVAKLTGDAGVTGYLEADLRDPGRLFVD
jgi:hypothetical protein